MTVDPGQVESVALGFQIVTLLPSLSDELDRNDLCILRVLRFRSSRTHLNLFLRASQHEVIRRLRFNAIANLIDITVEVLVQLRRYAERPQQL